MSLHPLRLHLARFWPDGPPRGHIGHKLLLLAAVVVVSMYYRRPDQFQHPYLWVEDGGINLPEYIEHGWMFVFRPIVGYFILPVRVLFGAAASLSFRWLPEISFALSLLFTYAVLVSIMTAPTHLRHRFLCAASVMLIPSDSEVFGVALYSGWWGTLLAFIPIFWREDVKGHLPLRSTFLITGGLSTPVAIGLLPFFAFRAYRWRTRSEVSMLALCAALAGLQGTALVQSSAAVDGDIEIAKGFTLIAKFFGNYLYWTPTVPQSHLYTILGLALVAAIGVAGYVRRHSVGWTFFGLVGCLVMVIALSIVRASVDDIHPVLAGPRYFFLPFVLTSWLLLYLLDRRHQGTTVLCASALLLALWMAIVFGTRTHQPVDWRAHVDACVRSERHTFPIHVTGHGAMWSVTVPGQACRELVQGGLFDNHLHRE